MKDVLQGLKRYDIEVEDSQICRVSVPEGRFVLFDDVKTLADSLEEGNDPSISAITFALELESSGYSDEGLTFLRLWNEGEFDTLRREWPEAPLECYIGADPMLPIV